MISTILSRGLAVGLVSLGAAAGFAAVPTAIMGPADSDTRAGAIDIELGVAEPARPRRVEPTPSGNPLWAIPLKELSATRERPIFSASRRPPPPAVVAAPYVPAPAVAKPVEPERLRLSLVGTIAGERQGFGIFLDQATNKVIRLKMGEGHRGWILRRVLGREVALQKDQETTLLALPAANAETTASTGAQLAGESNGKRSRR
jgi:general secretion pathway protein N